MLALTASAGDPAALRGKCTILGSGPGDPELLTVRPIYISILCSSRHTVLRYTALCSLLHCQAPQALLAGESSSAPVRGRGYCL